MIEVYIDFYQYIHSNDEESSINSTINSLSNRITALESSGSHHWEYIDWFMDGKSITLQKDYLFLIYLSYNQLPGGSKDFTGTTCIIDVESRNIHKGDVITTSRTSVTRILGYV